MSYRKPVDTFSPQIETTEDRVNKIMNFYYNSKRDLQSKTVYTDDDSKEKIALFCEKLNNEVKQFISQKNSELIRLKKELSTKKKISETQVTHPFFSPFSNTTDRNNATFQLHSEKFSKIPGRFNKRNNNYKFNNINVRKRKYNEEGTVVNMNESINRRKPVNQNFPKNATFHDFYSKAKNVSYSTKMN